MMEWKEVLFEDIIEEISMGPFGSDIKRDCYCEEGLPYLNGSNVQNFKLGEESFIYVPWEKAEKLKKSVAHRGDVIITHRGTLGQVVYIPTDSIYPKYLISNSQFRVKFDSSKVRADYITYYLHTRDGNHKIMANASQVGVPALGRPTTTFKQIKAPIPPLEYQNCVMDILSSLDKKIETNNKINANLEEMAQAIFKNWFVDFAPFKDGKFVESELGMIPEGWRVGTLSEVADIKKKSITPNKTPDSYFNHYSLPAFDVNKLPVYQLGSEIMSSKFIFGSRTTLISKLNPHIKRIWFVDNVMENGICSTEFIPIKAKDEEIAAYIHFLICSNIFYNTICSSVNGATNSHQRINPEDILEYKIALNEETISRYSKFAYPILKKISKNITENAHLASIRDTLLPRLMSGEIEV